MAQQQDNVLNAAIQEIIDHGSEGMEQAVTILFNEAMRVERSHMLNALPFERTSARLGYANGYKDKHLKSRLGNLDLKIPQVRGGINFYPSSLEKGVRSERALKISLAEMYIQGVSTRKVEKILKKMCGLDISSSEVSRATKLLDEELEKWRNRDLGKIKYLQLDARYEKTRRNGSVLSTAVLTAIGVNEDGFRSILGVSVSISEAEVHWRDFIISLKERGMHGVEYIVSDNHEGLKKALRSTLGSASWNRCHVHLLRNSFAYVPRTAMRKEVANDINNVLVAPDLETAKYLLDRYIEKYSKTASKLAQWMEDNIPDGFAVFGLEKRYRSKMRSTNMIERTNREIKRRTRVCSLFPNEESLLRLVSAVLMEISEEWESGKKYMNLNKIMRKAK
ncbi:MAG: IS256 family transposase [Deltaproteobacteria bacterium]|nr:MAG: IS256 family transposase [Deltaproteobacteria bacterium]